MLKKFGFIIFVLGVLACSATAFAAAQPSCYPTVPEPSSIAALVTGLTGIGAMAYRRMKK